MVGDDYLLTAHLGIELHHLISEHDGQAIEHKQKVQASESEVRFDYVMVTLDSGGARGPKMHPVVDVTGNKLRLVRYPRAIHVSKCIRMRTAYACVNAAKASSNCTSDLL